MPLPMTSGKACKHSVDSVEHRSGLRSWLLLGRVSNLPTVWSNTLVGLALGGLMTSQVNGELGTEGVVIPSSILVLTAMFIMSLFYIGGMLLNDAFDAKIDAIERPERPIPRGDVSRLLVFIIGFSLLISGVILIALIATSVSMGSGEDAVWATSSAIALGLCIVFYNVWHKSNPLSPLIMGMCRVFVYTTTAWLIAGAFNFQLLLAIVGLLGYLAGLTAIAKQENLNQIKNRWPLFLLFFPVLCWFGAGEGNVVTLFASLSLVVWILIAFRILLLGKPGGIPKAVGFMLAGISLVDAVALAALASLSSSSFVVSGVFTTEYLWIVVCFICFGLTLFFQRIIPGT